LKQLNKIVLRHQLETFLLRFFTFIFMLVLSGSLAMADSEKKVALNLSPGYECYCGEILNIKWNVSIEVTSARWTEVYCIYLDDSNREKRINIEHYDHLKRNGDINWLLPPEVCGKQIYIYVNVWGGNIDTSDMRSVVVIKNIVLRFSSPTSSNVYFSGNPLAVMWDTKMQRELPPANASIWLSKPFQSGRENIKIGEVTLTKKGAFVWNVPDNFTVNNAYIYILWTHPQMSLVANNQSDTFSVYPKPHLEVLSPGTGEVYAPGQKVVIRWRKSGGKSGSYINIKYSFPPSPLRDAGHVNADENSFEWKIPEGTSNTSEAMFILEWVPSVNSQDIWFRARSEKFKIQIPAATKIIIKK